MSEKQNSGMATLLKKRTIQADGLEACAWQSRKSNSEGN